MHVTERHPLHGNPPIARARARAVLPMLWLFSDARNDAGLDDALTRLPHGSGFVFRHYHLDDAERRERFDALAAIARRAGHLVILADTAEVARAWGADGVYGPAAMHAADDLWRLAAAHDGDELEAANGARVDGVFLSPVFATASHPGAPTLGPMGFQVLAQRSLVPVIALGGVTRANAPWLDWPRWGAIDGLASPLSA